MQVILKELNRYGIDVAAIQEIRREGKETIELCVTLFWERKTKTECGVIYEYDSRSFTRKKQ